ncbi:MAG: hypothetical protein WC903_06975 [Candidatus Margulisiibacteriota bacterium]
MKAGNNYVYEKTLRALLQKIETGKYQPELDREEADFHLKEEVLKIKCSEALKIQCGNVGLQYKSPEDPEAWQVLIERLFNGVNLSRVVVEGKNSDNQRFPVKDRQNHVEVLNSTLHKLSVIEDWFYHNPEVLRQIVANF